MPRYKINGTDKLNLKNRLAKYEAEGVIEDATATYDEVDESAGYYENLGKLIEEYGTTEKEDQKELEQDLKMERDIIMSDIMKKAVDRRIYEGKGEGISILPKTAGRLIAHHFLMQEGYAEPEWLNPQDFDSTIELKLDIPTKELKKTAELDRIPAKKLPMYYATWYRDFLNFYKTEQAFLKTLREFFGIAPPKTKKRGRKKKGIENHSSLGDI